MTIMIKEFFLSFFLLCCISSHAQLSGVVTNAKEKPEKNIMIRLKTASDTTYTDNNGKFRFESVTANDTLIVAYSSRYEAVIPIGDMHDISIMLSKKNCVVKNNGNQETLTVDYQRSQKRMLSDNIITREMIEEMSATNIYDILRYNIQGVKVTDNSEGSRIIIRNSQNEPLFVVDGIYFDSSAEVDIRVSATDIERIEILRDGEGYGYRGGNGVIVITSRK